MKSIKEIKERLDEINSDVKELFEKQRELEEELTNELLKKATEENEWQNLVFSESSIYNDRYMLTSYLYHDRESELFSKNLSNLLHTSFDVNGTKVTISGNEIESKIRLEFNSLEDLKAVQEELGFETNIKDKEERIKELKEKIKELEKWQM